MKKNIFVMSFFLMSLLFIGAGCVNYSSNNLNTRKKPLSGSSNVIGILPDVILKYYNGKDVRLRSFIGKPLIVNSWASWCPFCVNELSDFAKLQKEFSSQLAVIAINRSEALSQVKKFSDKLNVSEGVIWLLNSSDSFFQKIGGFAMPETIFVDKNGNIVDHKRGPMNLAEMREKTKKLLGLN